jgi:hypothetical protein
MVRSAAHRHSRIRAPLTHVSVHLVILIHLGTHVYTRTRTRTRTHTHTHTSTHTHTQIHTHARTHTTHARVRMTTTPLPPGFSPDSIMAAERHVFLLCGGDLGVISPLRVAHLLLERLGGQGQQDARHAAASGQVRAGAAAVGPHGFHEGPPTPLHSTPHTPHPTHPAHLNKVHLTHTPPQPHPTPTPTTHPSPPTPGPG